MGDIPCTYQVITRMGRYHDVRRDWVQFDGNRLHYTERFVGRRTSIVAFTIDRFPTTPADVREDAARYGFAFPWEDPALLQMSNAKHLGNQGQLVAVAGG